MEKMTIKGAWRHCYAAARVAARQYQTGLYYANTARIDTATYYFMLAADAIRDASMGYSVEGYVCSCFSPHGFIFNAYTRDNDCVTTKCHTFKFKFGESTPENKNASDNRRQWQRQAQSVERIAELRNAKRDIARLLNGMTDEDFFKAYAAIKTTIKATR